MVTLVTMSVFAMPQTDLIKLTSLSSCAGCAAKLSQTLLTQMLCHLPPTKHRNLLVDANTCDDAGIYRVRPDLALVQTVDFFTPIVDSPYDYGQIAAANALSDVYAMGGRPITAMNLLAIPTDKLNSKIAVEILRGGAAKIKQSGAILVGGHTIRSLEPIYGCSITGTVHPKKILTNANARPGDLLILTKPLGTGITTTGIKRGLASESLANRAIKFMSKLNLAGAKIGEKQLANAATDVTGFGLLGHLGNICRASKIAVRIDVDAVPVLSDEVFDLIDRGCVPGGTESNLAAAESFVKWINISDRQKILLADAQTSGGLLLCVPPKKLAAVRRILKSTGDRADVIGTFIKAASPHIVVAA
jgi:selenide,water dikinase